MVINLWIESIFFANPSTSVSPLGRLTFLLPIKIKVIMQRAGILSVFRYLKDLDEPIH